MAEFAPPRGELYRFDPRMEIRQEGDNGRPKLVGYPIRFNEATRIQSMFEGDFIERIAPGAAKKTLEENLSSMQILFNHGHDPQLGEMALAEPKLIEDSKGVRYDEPELLDGIPPLLLSGLRAGRYGSSFKFMAMDEVLNSKPEASKENPDGLPERTITTLRLYEAGPVTFPAYEGATAGIRSLTDRYRHFDDNELADMLERAIALDPDRARAILEEREAAEAETLPDNEQHPPKAEETHLGTGRQKALYGATQGRQTEPTWRL